MSTSCIRNCISKQLSEHKENLPVQYIENFFQKQKLKILLEKFNIFAQIFFQKQKLKILLEKTQYFFSKH